MPSRLLPSFAFCLITILGAQYCSSQDVLIDETAAPTDASDLLPERQPVDEASDVVPGEEGILDGPEVTATDSTVNADGNTEADGFTFRVVRLKKIRAIRTAATLREFCSDWLGQGLTIDASSQNNSIVMRGRPDWLTRIQETIALLESAVAEDSIYGPNHPISRNPLATSVDDSRHLDFNQKIRVLASRFQGLAEIHHPNSQQVRRVVDEARTLVERAFDLRQRHQQQQIQQLQHRLSKLRQQVRQRDERRQQIVEQAVGDLLLLGKKDGQADRRQRLLNALGSIGVANESKSVLNQSDTRLDPLDSASALSNQETHPTLPSELQRAKRLVERGYMTAETYRNLQVESAAKQADLETNIKRLELNVEEARVELTFAKEEYDEAKSARAAIAISESELRELALKRRQAELKLARATLELEAARRRLEL